MELSKDEMHFAAQWWAAEHAQALDRLCEAINHIEGFRQTAGAMLAFIERAMPLMSPAANGAVQAPNYVTANMVCGDESLEFTIRRHGGKTPADIISELTAENERLLDLTSRNHLQAQACECLAPVAGYTPGMRVVAWYLDYSVAVKTDCPKCGGTGAVLV